VSGQLHAPAALPSGKSPRYPLYRRLGGPHSRSGQHGEVNFLTLPGLEPRPLSRPARSQSLYRLRYPGSHIALRREKINETFSKEFCHVFISFTVLRKWRRIIRQCRSSSGYSLASHRGGPGSLPGRACGVCGRQSGIGAGFLRVLRFPMPIIIAHISPSS
jgi:hypothetical protein